MNNTKALKIMVTSVLALSISIPALSVSAQATTVKATTTQTATPAKVDHLTAEQQKSLIEVAGFDNVKQFTGFYANLRRAVAQNNKEAVAQRISYPLSIYSNSKKRSILNKKQFIAEYDKIMTTEVKKALANQRLDELFIRDQGVMVGNGEIWMAILDNKLGVYTINQQIHQ